MSANPSTRIIRFSTFEVDLQTGELRQRGQKVKLQEQPFQVLAALLEQPGEVVTREDLRGRLWPADTFVDFDHSLNAAIKRLRDALGETADTPIFIETLARRGYRFIAPVNGGSTASGAAIAAAPERSKSSFLRSWVAIALLSAILIAVLVWALWRHPSRRTEVIERKLTANSSENSVSSAAVSPDGKYLAYADNTGIYLKLIGAGEVHPVPLPPNFPARVDDWFPDGSHLLVSRAEPTGKSGLWSISVFGGSPRWLADDAFGGSLSPNGAHIAFRRGDMAYGGLFGREEWVMRFDGTDQIKVATGKPDDSLVGAAAWSPDGKRIAYVRTSLTPNPSGPPTRSVEVNEWQNAIVGTLFSDSRLTPALHWLPDGRLIYALGSAQDQQDSSLWAVSLQQSKKISSPPKRITGGHGLISQVTGSADGKIATFVSGIWVPSVYIGTLAADGTHLLAHRRLTLDEYQNNPLAWTPDSKAVLVFSDRKNRRNGKGEIFKQDIDQPLAESLMTSADQIFRVTPDSSEILYISSPQPGSSETLSSIFAIPIGGGTPRLVLKDAGIWNLQCARLPSTICLYSRTKGDTTETFRFDVRSGKDTGPPQVDICDPECNWSLSPDGSQRAIIGGANDGKIHFRSTSTGKTRDLVVKGWNELMNIDWSADGKSLLVTWDKHGSGSALLNVTLDGKASPLLQSGKEGIWYAIPSPDGRFLAIAEAGGPKNVWQVENF